MTMTRKTISLSQKTKGSLLTLAWRELTNEARAETVLAWAMPCKEEEDDSQLTTNREQYQARLNNAEVRRKKTKSIALLRTISLSQKTKGSLLTLAWREIALLRTISLSQKAKGSLLALAWRGNALIRRSAPCLFL